MKYSNAQSYDDNFFYLAESWCPILVSPVITATGKYTINAQKDCIIIVSNMTSYVIHREVHNGVSYALGMGRELITYLPIVATYVGTMTT